MSVTYVLQDRVRTNEGSAYVTGHDRHKYFKRPLIPMMQDTAHQFYALEPLNQIPEQENLDHHVFMEEPKTRTVEVQTMYRESEAQTDPYTPAYQVKEGDNPEILTLAHLTYGNGLPATFDELEAIELAREKKAFEWALPPTSDEASFQLRRRLMEEQELREWANRENEIKKLQNEKMNLLKSALKEREKDVEEKNARRIDDIKIRKTEQKNRLIAKIQRKKIKVLRKLMKSKKQEEEPELKRDIIDEYHNFASRVYAAIAREGLSIDKLSNKYEVQPISLTNYQGVHDLAMTIKPSLLETNIQVYKLITRIEKSYTRLELAHRLELKKAQDAIEKRLVKVVKSSKDAKNVADDIKYRAATPERPHGGDARHKDYKDTVSVYRTDEKRDNAIILLQRLLRGRANQNMMYEGKEKRLALIEELLIVANVEALSENAIQDRLLQAHEEKLKDAVVESIQGEVMARAFDMLSKELIRFKQEKKIDRLVNIAENDRRKREAEERGRRQAEDILSRREDLLYQEIMKTHQGTVDTFLDTMFFNAVETASSRQAGLMSNLRKEKIESKIEDLETKHSKPQAVIKDLVAAFLIPNIQKNKLQKKIALEEKRFTETAKRTMVSTLVDAKNQ